MGYQNALTSIPQRYWDAIRSIVVVVIRQVVVVVVIISASSSRRQGCQFDKTVQLFSEEFPSRQKSAGEI
jgi:hypothetical protein